MAVCTYSTGGVNNLTVKDPPLMGILSQAFGPGNVDDDGDKDDGDSPERLVLLYNMLLFHCVVCNFNQLFMNIMPLCFSPGRRQSVNS